MDARCDSALRVSCWLERLSDGSGWRGYLYPLTSLAPVGLRPAALARRRVSPVYGVGCPQFGPGNCVDLRRPPLRVALFPRRLRGPGAHSAGQGLTVIGRPRLPPYCGSLPPRRAAGPGAHNVGQGLTVTAAPIPRPWLTPSGPQCRPRANCDGCAYRRTS